MRFPIALTYGVGLVMLPLLGSAGVVLLGHVQDPDGEPIVGATIVCKGDKTVGCTSNLDGFFAFNSLAMCDTLLISHVLYEACTLPTSSFANGDTLLVTLSEKVYEVESVAVQGRMPIARQMAITRMSEMDVYQSPIAQGDPLRAITTLAASTSTTEMANPEFRGSPSGYATVALNKVPIENPVRYSQLNNLGLFSLFHPALIDHQWIYPSNPPVTVGRAISGLVDIRTKERLYSSSGYVSVGLGGAGCIFSQRLRSDETFLQVYANGQASDLMKAITPRAYPEVKSFYSGDIGFNLRVRLAPRMHLNWYAYGVYDTFRGESGSMNYYGAVRTVRWRVFNVLNLVHTHSKWGVTSLNLGCDWNLPRTEMGNLAIREEKRRFYAAVDHRFKLRWLEVESGVAWEDCLYKYGGKMPRYPFLMGEAFPGDWVAELRRNGIVDGFLFLHFPIKAGDIFSVSLGAKAIKPLVKGSRVAYNAQAMLRVLVTKHHSLLLAGGHYASLGATNVYSPTPTMLASDQVNLDYEYCEDPYLLKGAMFWKRENVVVESYSGGLRDVALAIVPSWGWEGTWEQRVARYWSYGASVSVFQRRPVVAFVGLAEKMEWMYFVKANVQYSNSRLLSVTVSYAMHYGGYLSRVSEARYIEELDAFFPSVLRAERLKPYQRVDLVLSRQFTFNRWALNLFVMVNNVFNRKNVREYYYSNDYQHAYPLHLQLRNLYMGAVFMF